MKFFALVIVSNSSFSPLLCLTDRQTYTPDIKTHRSMKERISRSSSLAAGLILSHDELNPFPLCVCLSSHYNSYGFTLPRSPLLLLDNFLQLHIECDSLF